MPLLYRIIYFYVSQLMKCVFKGTNSLVDLSAQFLLLVYSFLRDIESLQCYAMISFFQNKTQDFASNFILFHFISAFGIL